MALGHRVDQIGLPEGPRRGDEVHADAEADRLLCGDNLMIHEIDPLEDPRWPVFLTGNPRASVFHTRGWLEAVYRTYGFKPSVLTTSAANSGLTNGLVFCRVQSWVTGRRLVSLPFSDHCEPLVESEEELLSLLPGLERRSVAGRCKYVELRPTSAFPEIPSNWRSSQVYYFHRLDLRPGASAVFRRFHRDCIQRRIRHAEKHGVVITEGRGPDVLGNFYGLLLQTRRRHGLPPQPMTWFRNLMDCLGESCTLRCAWKEGQPIAAILTLQYGKTLYYKYGASAARFHKFGAMPFLFWHAIQDAISCGLEELDMGRSDFDNLGLVTFKERWAATRSILSYWRSPSDAPRRVCISGWKHDLAREACRYMPEKCLAALGLLAYRHVE